MRLRSPFVPGGIVGVVGVVAATCLVVSSPASAGAAVVPESGVVARAAAPDTTDAFSFAVVPDTQQEVLTEGDDRLQQRMRWLVRKKVAFVAQVGDLTNWGWLAPEQLQRASEGLRPLEQAGIPYAVSVGNHDTRAVGWDRKGGYGGDAYVNNPECQQRLGDECRSHLLVRHTEEINAVLTADRFGAVRGAYEQGKIDNSYSTFRAGGLKWLVVSLELWPRQGALDWAGTVMKAHPHHNVIVQTHSYLEGNGSISRSNGGYGSTSPRHMWTSLLSRHANVRFVLSGHTGQAAQRVDKGRAGNTVVSMLQTFHSNSTNPVRMVKVLPRANRVKTSIVGPINRTTFPKHSKTIAMRFVR